MTTVQALEPLAEDPDLAGVLQSQLAALRATWHDTAAPMNHGQGSSSGAPALPASTVVLRADITLTLSFWVHALVTEFPTVLQHLAHVPVPTTDPAHTGWTLITVTEPIDCSDVFAMCDLLERERHRLAKWGDYGHTLAGELKPLVDHALLVSRPPRRDRIDVGPCPNCGRAILVKAPKWRRLPVPTSDPSALAPWTGWQPAQDQLITCRGCGRRETLLGWQAVITGPQRLLTAEQLVDQIHAEFGMRYSPVTIRVWARRGLIQSRGQRSDGRSVYDRVQVFAALMDREAARRGA